MNTLQLGLISLFSAVILNACNTKHLSDPHDNPNMTLPAGSTLQLHQALKFNTGYSRTFLQHGKPVSYNEVDIRNPYCKMIRFDSPESLQSERQVDPDLFNITKVSQSEEFASIGFMLSGRFSFGIGIGSGAEIDGGGSEATLVSIIKLQSARQPEITELRCEIFSDPILSNHVSINEIKKTLGSVATINFKP